MSMTKWRHRTKGFVIVAVATIGGLGWLALVPNEASRIELNQFRAARSLKELQAAEQGFAAANLRLGFTCDLSQLADAGLVDRVLAGGQKAGYRFSLARCTTDSKGTVVSFRATAIPQNPQLGSVSFCTDQGGATWYTNSSSTANCFESRLKWDRFDPLSR
jgi:hypothetical protein